MKTALVSRPMDRPIAVANLVQGLGAYYCFDVTVFCCAVRSSWESVPAGRQEGKPGANVALGNELQRRRGRAKQQCDDIAWTMKQLSLDKEPNINYIQGRSHDVAATLSSSQDLVVVPHRFQVPGFLGYLFRDLDA